MCENGEILRGRGKGEGREGKGADLRMLEEMHDGDGGEEAREVRHVRRPEVVGARVARARVETKHESHQDAGHDDVAESEHRHLRVVAEQTGAEQVLREHHCPLAQAHHIKYIHIHIHI